MNAQTIAFGLGAGALLFNSYGPRFPRQKKVYWLDSEGNRYNSKEEMTLRGGKKRALNLLTPTAGESSETQLSKEADLESCTVHTSLSNYSCYQAPDGKQKINIGFHSRGHSSAATTTWQHVRRMLLPDIKIRNRSYGTFLVPGVDFTNRVTTAPTFVDTVRGFGNARNHSSQLDLSNWTEIMHLPCGGQTWPLVGTAAIPKVGGDMLSTGLTLLSLMAIAKDQANVQPIYNANTSSSMIPTSNLRFKYYQQLVYKGGQTVHTWTNPGTNDVHAEFIVARPKKPLAINNTPLALAILDKNLHSDFNTVSLQPTLYPQTKDGYGTGVTQTLTNPNFNINKNMNNLHFNYVLTKPKRVVIAPGGTCRVSINHPAFNFSDTPWNGSITGAAGTIANSFTYLPFCSCFLLVRTIGSVVTDDSTGTVTLEGFAATNLVHHQYESHGIQAGFSGLTDIELDYNTITDQGVTLDFELNTENDVPQANIP